MRGAAPALPECSRNPPPSSQVQIRGLRGLLLLFFDSVNNILAKYRPSNTSDYAFLIRFLALLTICPPVKADAARTGRKGSLMRKADQGQGGAHMGAEWASMMCY